MKTRNSIAFVDTEIDPQSGKILDAGSINGNKDTFHSASISRFTEFLNGTCFLCGHNIIHHDLNYIIPAVENAGMDRANIIDTLFLSPFFFRPGLTMPCSKTINYRQRRSTIL